MVPSLHLHFFLQRMPHRLSACHRPMVTNAVNVAMAVRNRNRTLVTATTSVTAWSVDPKASSLISLWSPNPDVLATSVIYIGPSATAKAVAKTGAKVKAEKPKFKLEAPETRSDTALAEPKVKPDRKDLDAIDLVLHMRLNEKTGNRQRMPSTGVWEAFSFHDGLVKAAAEKEKTSLWDCNLVYDRNIITYPQQDDVVHRTRNMLGRFYCTSCREGSGQRKWHSAEICTRLWFKHTPGSERPGFKDTIRYKAVVYHQKCQGCENYMLARLNRDSYTRTLIKAFELWTKRREREEPKEFVVTTDPHDKNRCAACISGVYH